MMIEVCRSPARVCWHIKANGVTIDTKDTRKAAIEQAHKLGAKYKLGVKLC